MKISVIIMLTVMSFLPRVITAQTEFEDTLKGKVTDAWGRDVPDVVIKAPVSKTITTTDSLGNYSLPVSKKDKNLRISVSYTSGYTLRIAGINRKKPLDLSVMLDANTLRGFLSEDMTTYYVGLGDTMYETIINQNFPNIIYKDGLVYIRKGEACSYYEVDGAPIDNLNVLEPQSIFSIKIIKDGTANIYGGQGQNGAVIIKTRGMQAMTPVPIYNSKNAIPKNLIGEEGLKAIMEGQGKGIVYSDGYVTIDGKRCLMYIINDMEIDNIANVDPQMIDEVMIIRTGVIPAYGEKAVNGVVLISARNKNKPPKQK
ncbi:MAG: hypothetical protein PHD21_08130 [Flavobacteriales bacterium]|nr:hypothetical protein [Flavobacteriales bacterium]